MSSVPDHHPIELRSFDRALIALIAIAFIGAILRLGQSPVSSPYSIAYGLYYLALGTAAVRVAIAALHLDDDSSSLIAAFVAYRVPLGLFMLYLLVERWDLGDLPGYVLQPIDVVRGLVPGIPDGPQFGNGVSVIAWLFRLLFVVQPISLLGASILAATLSYIGMLCAYRALVRTGENRVVLFVLIALPAVVTQESFIGKDPAMVFVFGVLLIALSRFGKDASRVRQMLAGLVIASLLVLVASLRLYQALLAAAALTVTVAWTRRRIGRLLSLVAISSAALVMLVPATRTLLVGLFSGELLSDILSSAYAGGNITLAPLPGPLQLLQTLRPFPWEAPNFLSLANSLEVWSVVGTLCLVVFFGRRRTAQAAPRPFVERFILVYSVILIVVFSNSSNIGDLSRRRIYFFPYLAAVLLIPAIAKTVDRRREPVHT